MSVLNGPELLVDLKMMYSVAPATADHDNVICLLPAVATKPVGTAGAFDVLVLA